MAVSEVLQGCGKWDVKFKADGIPRSVRDRISDGCTLLVFDAPVAEWQIVDAMRSSALFEGYCTEIGSSGLSGWEASWLIGQPDGSGPQEDFPGWGFGGEQYIDDFITGGLPVNGITASAGLPHTFLYDTAEFGLNGPASVYSGGSTLTANVRQKLDWMVRAWFRYAGDVYSWRINPGLTLDADEPANIYRDLTAAITSIRSTGAGGTVTNSPSVIDNVRSIENVVTDMRVYGDRDPDTGITDLYSATQTLPFNSPGNTALEILRLYEGAGSGSSYVFEDVVVRHFSDTNNARNKASVTVEDPRGTRVVSPGDRVYLWDGEKGVEDVTSSPIVHFGQTIFPLRMYVMSVTWDIQPHHTVVLRTPSGGYVDISNYVVTGDDRMSVSLSSRFEPPYVEKRPVNNRQTEDYDVAVRLSKANN